MDKMKCSRCSKDAVVHLKYSNQRLCKEHFCRLTERRIKRNIGRDELFNKDDKVVVAVSGEESSIVLLRFLKNFSEKLPMELFGIVVDEGIRGYSERAIEIAKKNFKELGVDYKIVSLKKEIGKSIDDIAKKDMKEVCSNCSIFKRRLLNNAARELKADKIATAHNLDDEVQSIVLNYMQRDVAGMVRIGSKSLVMKGFVQEVKPLCIVPEKEIELYATLKNYKFHSAECPYFKRSFRADIKKHLNELEAEHAGIKFSSLKGAEPLNSILEKRYVE